jgi:excisionase family DNA binding protein
VENIAPGDLITIEEAAAILGIPVATLRTWRINGKGPRGAVIGRRVKFIRTEVEAYLSQAFAEQNVRSA